MSLCLRLSQRPRPPPRHRRAAASVPTPSTRVKAPRTRRPRLDPEDVVVEGRVGAELRLLEAEGLAPGRLLRSFLWCWLCLVRRWRVSLSPRRCACPAAVGSAVGSAAGLAVGSEVGWAAAAAVAPRPGGAASARPSSTLSRPTAPWARTPSPRREDKTLVKNLDRRPEVEVRFGRRIKKPLELEAALGHEDLAR